MPTISIVGSGIAGLTCAHDLADLGDVTIYHHQPILSTTSAIATAIWHVYLVDPNDTMYLRWASSTLERLLEIKRLAPEAGIEVPLGVELFRTTAPHRPPWADIAHGFRALSDEELLDYPGRTWGYWIEAPTVNMNRYLPWLVTECQRRGISFRAEHITSLEDLRKRSDVVINCTGLDARHLVDDPELYPVKGQYLIYEYEPGSLEFYIGDDEHPDGMAYAIPRDGQLLVGGTAEEHDWSPEFTQDVDSLLRRATQFCKGLDLSSLKLVDKVVGYRPCRTSGHVRFGNDAVDPYILHNYGHGGSGFSMSWGFAHDMRALVANMLTGV